MADPDGEVVVNPTAREQIGQRVARRMFVEEFANLHRAHVPVADAAFVKGAEESNAAAGVVLPAVFAVENDAHQSWPIAGDGGPDTVELTDKIVGRGYRIATLVVEADQIA